MDIFNIRRVIGSTNCITPAGGPPNAEGPNRNKQTEVVGPFNPSKKTDFNLLINDMSLANNGSVQTSQREIMRRLGAFTNAELDMLIEDAAVSQPVYSSSHEKILKVTKTSDKAKWIPYSTFPQFAKLPKEVRIMVWGFAIPNLFEAFPDGHKSTRFLTSGPREAVLSLLHNYHSVFLMSPIYLPHLQQDTAVAIEPIYIRPADDILYLNTEALYSLDINAFITQSENQVIQNIALPVVPMERIRWCGKKLGRGVGNRSWLGDLVRGLKSLKKIYVVEGHTLHNESEVEYYDKQRYLTKYSLSLESCKLASETKDWCPPSIAYSPPAKPWNMDYAIIVEELFKAEVSRENSGKYDIVFEGEWNVPEIVCMELKRMLWSGVPNPKHWCQQDL